MINKVDAPEQEGNAFDAYRKKIANSGGGGDSPDAGGARSANVISFESLGLGGQGDKAGPIAPASGDEGADES